MGDTIIYFIRHDETLDKNRIRNTNEDFQMINEKEILFVQFWKENNIWKFL